MPFIVHSRSWLRERGFRFSRIFSMVLRLLLVFLWLMRVCMLLYSSFLSGLVGLVDGRVELYMLWQEKDKHRPFSQEDPTSMFPSGVSACPHYQPSSRI